MRLYRPVGMRELLRIFEADMTAFPPRLLEQVLRSMYQAMLRGMPVPMEALR